MRVFGRHLRPLLTRLTMGYAGGVTTPDADRKDPAVSAERSGATQAGLHSELERGEPLVIAVAFGSREERWTGRHHAIWRPTAESASEAASLSWYVLTDHAIGVILEPTGDREFWNLEKWRAESVPRDRLSMWFQSLVSMAAEMPKVLATSVTELPSALHTSLSESARLRPSVRDAVRRLFLSSRADDAWHHTVHPAALLAQPNVSVTFSDAVRDQLSEAGSLSERDAPAGAADALLRLVVDRMTTRGLTLEGLEPVDLERAADALIAALPRTDPAAAAIGPFYDTAGLARWLGITRQGLHARVARHQLLAVKTTDNPPRTLYPAWQFSGRGDVLAGVREALDALAPTTWSGLTSALWFAGASDALDGMSAAQWLQSGRDAEAVVRLARRAAAAWNR